MEHEPEEMLYPGKLPPPLPCRAHMCCLPLSQLMEALAASRGSGEVLVCPRRTQRCHPALKVLLVSPWSAQGQLMAFGLAGDLDMCWGRQGSAGRHTALCGFGLVALFWGQPGRGIEQPGLVGGIPSQDREMEQGAPAGPFKLRRFWDRVASPLCQKDEKKTVEMALLCWENFH